MTKRSGGTTEEAGSDKVTIVMNPLHPFADSAAGELAVKILLYHIEHHLCLGVYDYLIYIELAQARQLLASEDMRALIQQNRLHLVVWDLPVVRPRKRKKDAFGSPTPKASSFGSLLSTTMHFCCSGASQDTSCSLISMSFGVLQFPMCYN